MAFSPDYVHTVLNENFEDGKTLLLDPMMAIHYGHLAMLASQSIVAPDDARRIRDALRGIDLNAVRSFAYDGGCEDLFFHVDGLIGKACGAEVAGRLHTARSRNDMAMTMYRMRLRDHLLSLLAATLRLRRALLGVASRHTGTIYPAHTHTQPAQPTTVAHYLLAMVEELERDTTRLIAAYRSVNRSPLGACAITGTGFTIDRNRTSDLLGFDGPTGNTYGSIATVDYLLESGAAAAITLVGVGRFTQDMLLWCTSEIGYLRLPDGFVQVSSIMPQKRNPVALEHARGLLSKALGQMQAMQTVAHNTPFGDIVDTEDDLQPLVASAFKDAVRGVTLVAAAMADAEFDVAKMRARATEGWVTITELADTLVRDHGLPFVAAHGVASRVIGERRERPDASLSEIVTTAAREIAGRDVRISEVDLERVLSPDYFIAVRRTPGGPASDVVAQAIVQSEARLAADRADATRLADSLSAAQVRLNDAITAL